MSRFSDPSWLQNIVPATRVILLSISLGLLFVFSAANPCGAATQLSSEQQAVEDKLLDDAAKTIEQYRKGNVAIQIVSTDGQPVQDADITVRQVRHDFLFGCIGFLLVQNRRDEPLDLFKKRFADLFNFAIMPFYWASYESQPGQTMQEPTAAAVRWCHDNDITVKGHPLVWANRAGVPSWLRDRSGAERVQLAQQRVQREVSSFAGQIDIWDVVNEAVNMRPFDDLDSRDYIQAPISKIVPYVEKSFRTAHAANPQAHLILNEFNLIPQPKVRERFYQLAKELQQRGVPISGLGIQAHEPSSEWFPPQEVRDTLDRLASLGLALHITEFIPQSGGRKITGGWRTGTWDQQAQADYAEQIYRLAFGHPKVVSINWWGLCDRHIWQPKGGLVDENYQPKLVYKRLMKLIHEQWTTNLATKSDANGKANFRGFHGTYKVTVKTADGATRSFDCGLHKGQENKWVLAMKQ